MSARNSLCWCGSGKKLKKCHLTRGEQPLLTLQEIIEETNNSQIREECVHPNASKTNCSDKIIKAHTLQQNGVLDRISRNRMVYAIKVNLPNLLKKGLDPHPVLTNVKSASTLTCFCGKHDDELFAPIEKASIVPTSEQVFLLGYRALCREFYAKHVEKQTAERLRSFDRGTDENAQIFTQAFATSWLIGITTALRDIVAIKRRYDAILSGRQFDRLSYLLIEMQGLPDFVCAGSTYPNIDFEGTTLNRPEEIQRRAELISLSIVPTDNNRSIILLTWINGPDRMGERFIRSFLNLNQIDQPSAILRFAFNSFENLFLRPEWWEGLKETDKAKLFDRIRNNADPEAPVVSLMDDGLRLISWHFSPPVYYLSPYSY